MYMYWKQAGIGIAVMLGAVAGSAPVAAQTTLSPAAAPAAALGDTLRLPSSAAWAAERARIAQAIELDLRTHKLDEAFAQRPDRQSVVVHIGAEVQILFDQVVVSVE